MDSIGNSGWVAITATGMVTSLGSDVANCCAAARAGVVRPRELRIINPDSDQIWGGEFPVGHVAPIPEGFLGYARVLLLARRALQDLLSKKHFSSDELKRTGVYITLSDQFFPDTYLKEVREQMLGIMESYAAEADAEPDQEDDEADDVEEVDESTDDSAPPSATWKHECRFLLPALLDACNLTVPARNQHVSFADHVGLIQAVESATTSLVSGEFDYCIVGGVDSCIELQFLEAAAQMQSLKTAVNPFGFLPGEAAAFLLLERVPTHHSRNDATRIADLEHTPATSAPDDPPTGAELTKSLESILSRLAKRNLTAGVVIGDLNGDPRRASHWGYSIVRLQNKYRVGDLPIWLPAQSFGEVGAATGAVALCMARAALQRGYAPKGRILVWLLSHTGESAAMCVEGQDEEMR
jgi:hypothetical protein